MSTAGIMQLYTDNEITNAYMNNKSMKYSCIYNKFSFDGCQKTITNIQLPDFMIPNYLISNVKLRYFQINISQVIINTLDLELCNKIAGLKDYKFGDKYKYKIPWEKLGYKKIQTLNLKTITFLVSTKEDKNFDPKITLFTESYFFNFRGKFFGKSSTEIYSQFTEHDFELKENEIVKHKIIVNQSCKGFIMDNVNINNIINLKFVINGHTRIEYDEDMLLLFVEKISDDCYYISFDNLGFIDGINNWNSYIGLNKLDHKELEIKSKTNQKIKLRFLILNLLHYNNFLVGKQYNYTYVPCINYKPSPIAQIIKKIDICPICRDSDSNIITQCKHQYCLSCLDEYTRQSGDKKCPLCRQIITFKYQIILEADNKEIRENQDDAVQQINEMSIEEYAAYQA